VDAGAAAVLDCAAAVVKALCAIAVPDHPPITKSEHRAAQQIAIITLFVISPLLFSFLSLFKFEGPYWSFFAAWKPAF
jgi:hypothetical protein